MSSESVRKLCLALLDAGSEASVISTLQSAGYWDDPNAWSLFGDRENNYSIIGSQQASPVYALVEKLVNSVDAVLMRECQRRGISPESENAPPSIAAALQMYFGMKDGNLVNIGASRRTELAGEVGLIATGTKTKPNYIVFDRGEGQTPAAMPHTFLSLAESNKLRIAFVQGKFNMGGSGVLRFCGRRRFNLIISRRDPTFAESEDPTASDWGFTIVRREDPKGAFKNSVYTYLAPGGSVLRFKSKSLEVVHNPSGTQQIEPLEWGSIVKLYEYEIPGLKTNILFDLYNEISLLLPRAGLPVRFYERRGYRGHSLETTMAGLHVRLEEDKRENLEPGFPTGFEFEAMGEKFLGTIYTFKKDGAEKYKKNEGILFTSNGQTHGNIPQSFFTRKRVGMSYLASSLLVIVECDQISRLAREDLFMNSRDRLSKCELRTDIERELEPIISQHPGLRELRERRRREAVDSKLSDSKPLKDVLNSILKKSPALAALFTVGADIKNPFKSRYVSDDVEFDGKPHPTHFTIFNRHKEKNCHRNLRFRVQFETDVVNDYFERDAYPGTFRLFINGEETSQFVRNLWNGVATITISLPEEVGIGDGLHYQAVVCDETQIDPFTNEFFIHVIEEKKADGGGNGRKPPAGDGPGDRPKPDSLQLPQVNEVREDRWDEFGFDRYSALKVHHTGDDGYDFHLNMDNVFLRTELKHKAREDQAKLVEAQYKYAIVLLGLTILKDDEVFSGEEDSEDELKGVEEIVAQVTKSVSPVLIPMINALGSLELEEVVEVEGSAELEYE